MKSALRAPSETDLGAIEQLLGRPIDRAIDLRTCSRWRVGGIGSALIEPTSEAELGAVLELLHDRSIIAIVIGDGSNILFDDAGFDGVIVRIGSALSSVEITGTRVVAQAGAWIPSLVRMIGAHGLTGLEHAIGIPGNLGGLVIMNGGSRRMGIGSTIVSVRGFDRSGVAFERGHAECAFRYRGSTLQDDHLVVSAATLELTCGDAGTIRREMIGIMADRRSKFPKHLPNCGSVFLSDPAMYSQIGPPGFAIEKVGLKGRIEGGAQISPQHANFIVNNGNARSADILHLVRLSREAVLDATGFAMDAEVRHIDRNGVVRPAHLAAGLL